MHQKIIKFFLIFLIIFPTSTKASSIVMDIDSGRILYENNIHEKKLIASITKIMTAIIAIENNDLNKKITVGKEILSMYGTNIYIEVGEIITIKDLLYGLILRSGNDSAIALATATSKTEEKFVELMNDKAKKIGMKNTIFQNSHGLDDYSKNYSTAYDMAILSSYAYKNKIYREIASTKRYTTKTKNKTYLWNNRNKLLNNYKYCTGGKNGYTPDAGRTLVTTASNNDLNLTIVTLNEPNEYDKHENLYNDTFEKYKNYTILDKDKFYIDKNFINGTPYIKKSFIYPLKENEFEKITTKIFINNQDKKQAGKIKITLGDKEIETITIYNKEQKKESSIAEKFFLKIKNLITR